MNAMKIPEDKAATANISLPVTDLAALKANALQNRRSLSAEIRHGLAAHLQTLHSDFAKSPDLVAAAAAPIEDSPSMRFYPDVAKAVRAL
jgi:hypothetical protein